MKKKRIILEFHMNQSTHYNFILPGLRLPELGFTVNLFSSFPGGIDSSHLEMTSLSVQVNEMKMM